MIQIQSYITTDEQLTATQLDIRSEGACDIYVDIVWHLYDSNGGYVDDGRFTLSGDDFTAWQANEAYGETYVMNQKGITIA